MTRPKPCLPLVFPLVVPLVAGLGLGLLAACDVPPAEEGATASLETTLPGARDFDDADEILEQEDGAGLDQAIVADDGEGLAAATPHAVRTATAPRLEIDAGRETLATLQSRALEAGDRMYLSGGYTADNPYGFNVLQGAQLRCTGPRGVESRSVFTTRNVVGHGKGTVRVHWLFKVPTSGNYRCELRAHASANPVRDEQKRAKEEMRTAKRYFLSTSAPALGMDASSYDGGVEWRQTKGGTVRRGKTVKILRHTFVPGAAARTIAVDADVELTNDYKLDPSGSATVEVTARITQAPRGDGACAKATALVQRRTITAAVHHDKLYFRFRNVPIRNDEHCARKFAIEVAVHSTAGNPVDYNAGAPDHYSNGIALSR